MKFIDDYNIVELVTGRGDCLRASETEIVLKRVIANAEILGMKIHPGKTQTLCVSNNKKISTYLEIQGVKISSQEEMKLVGFRFGQGLNADSHVEEIERTFNQRVWLLRNLVRAGWSASDITKVYTTSVRSAIEYMVPVYHSLITNMQATRLENLQRKAQKMMYGWNKSYTELLSASGLVTLRERREIRLGKIVRKLETNGRFRDMWLQKNSGITITRKHNKYSEERVKTLREYRLPTNYYTRRLNREHRA